MYDVCQKVGVKKKQMWSKACDTIGENCFFLTVSQKISIKKKQIKKNRIVFFLTVIQFLSVRHEFQKSKAQNTKHVNVLILSSWCWLSVFLLFLCLSLSRWSVVGLLSCLYLVSCLILTFYASRLGWSSQGRGGGERERDLKKGKENSKQSSPI